MKAFISWSGQQSKAIAIALKNWIPDAMQQVDVWMSEHDIDAGSRWGNELSSMLEEANFGIICLTAENQNAPWLLFEAGCLAKASKVARVVPYLYGLSPTDVRYPLAQFQGVTATKPGTLKLLQSLNEAGKFGMTTERLSKSLEQWWKNLAMEFSKISVDPQVHTAIRSERDILEELLGLVRNSLRSRAPKTMRPAETLTVTVDTSKYFKEGPVVSVAYDAGTTVSQFLDSVFFAMHDVGDVKAFQYGIEWLLQDQRTGRTYDDIGIEYCRTLGAARTKERLLQWASTLGTDLKLFALRRRKPVRVGNHCLSKDAGMVRKNFGTQIHKHRPCKRIRAT